MIMKKILLLVAAVALSSAVTAQSVGVFNFGGNMSKFNKNSDNLLGYQVGFTNDFGGFLRLEPGLYLMHKGGKSGDNKTNLNYLQIPINLKINVEVGPIRVIGGVGVYGSLGLWANRKNGDNKSKIKFYDKDDEQLIGQMNPWDFGGQVFAGVIINRIGVTVGYQPGFANISKVDNADMKNGSFYVTLSTYMGDPAAERTR
jgi:hypothetical protein